MRKLERQLKRARAARALGLALALFGAAVCSAQSDLASNLVSRGTFAVGGAFGTNDFAGSHFVVGPGIDPGPHEGGAFTNHIGTIATRQNPPYFVFTGINIVPENEQGYLVSDEQLRRRLRVIEPDRQTYRFRVATQQGTLDAGGGPVQELFLAAGSEFTWTLPPGVQVPPAAGLQVDAYDGSHYSLSTASVVGLGFNQVMPEIRETGSLELRFAAQPGQTYEVQDASTFDDWQILGVATNTRAKVFEFTVENVATAGFRFYRIAERP